MTTLSFHSPLKFLKLLAGKLGMSSALTSSPEESYSEKSLEALRTELELMKASRDKCFDL